MSQSFHLDRERVIFSDGREISLYSEESFALLSELWLKVGWDAHYHYSFTWLGQPVLQLPEDLMRLQEVIVTHDPDLIIETGVAMGGSLLFYATICAARGKGRVIGIDIDLRPPMQKVIREHPLSRYITLIQGSSIERETVEKISFLAEEKVMVILDANHSKEHVAKELELFAPLVSENQYLVVADGFKEKLFDTPRGKKYWQEDHPAAATKEFLLLHPEFTLHYPDKIYNRCCYRKAVTHFTQGWLLRAHSF